MDGDQEEDTSREEKITDWNSIKERVAEQAVSEFFPQQDRCLIGLGSGSTSRAFIAELGRRKNKKIGKNQYTFVATSTSSHLLATSLQLHVIDDAIWTEKIDITFDGADFVDIQNGIIIKGLGGALLREKMIAYSSKRFFLLVDERKILQPNQRNVVTIPIEIAPFAILQTKKHTIDVCQSIMSGTTTVDFRYCKNNSSALFITDNNNIILDILCTITSSHQLLQLHAALVAIPGIYETGIFKNCVTDILVGYSKKKVLYHSLPLLNNE